ncbi:MAG: M14 family zinc carboxypeptidase, partial [Nitrososphaeraceae archaeon]
MSENTKNRSIESNHVKKADNKFVDYQIIGRTIQKRRLDIVFIGKLIDPKLKIFIMAGQHGDEKLSRKATERLISHLIKTKG